MSRGAAKQILLPIGFRKEHVFGSYFSEHKPCAAAVLKVSVFERKEPVCAVVGPKECGKTHLCAAIVNEAQSRGIDACYLSFKEVLGSMPSKAINNYLESFATTPVMVLDDVDVIAGNSELELTLFNLYNQCTAESRQLILSSRLAVADVGFSLADLVSRFQFALTVRLKLLSDEGKQTLFVRLAAQRGMNVSRDVAGYISVRSERNMNALMDVLERLDHASLLEKRSLTVPFVKKVMGW